MAAGFDNVVGEGAVADIAGEAAASVDDTWAAAAGSKAGEASGGRFVAKGDGRVAVEVDRVAAR